MVQNSFDLGYELLRVDHCTFHLRKLPDLPIVEFCRHRYIDDFSGKKMTSWSLRPLPITDEKIDATLPKDWKDRAVYGFKNFSEILDWLNCF